MNLEQYNRAKDLLLQIAELEKKASVKAEYNTIRIMVSTNGTSFTEVTSIIGKENSEDYKSSILKACNNSKDLIDSQIKKLQEEFDNL